MSKLQGISLSGLKKHPVLIPLYICVGAAGVAAFSVLMRVASVDPEVTWSTRKNPEPWNDYSEKQAKMYTTKKDDELKTRAPKY